MQGIIYFIFINIALCFKIYTQSPCNLVILNNHVDFILIKTDCIFSNDNKNNHLTFLDYKTNLYNHVFEIMSKNELNIFIEPKFSPSSQLTYKKDGKKLKIILKSSGKISINKQQDNIKISCTEDQILPTGRKENITIAIDPGHGGFDPGTSGTKTKVKEKDITLLYAIKLKKKLEQMGLKAVLTRSKDQYLSLQDRISTAKKMNADLFISVHADYMSNSPQVKGASIYTISNINRNHDDRKLFKKERYVPSLILKKESSKISDIIIDFIHSLSRNHSRELASRVLVFLKKESLCKTCKIRDASFAVLRRIDIPSILIEIGYLSNEEDERDIMSEKYQKRIIDSLAAGIVDYLEQ